MLSIYETKKSCDMQIIFLALLPLNQIGGISTFQLHTVATVMITPV